MAKKKDLTILQQRFVDVLFAMPVPNQREAYLRVYNKRKVKPGSADVLSNRMLKKVKVAAYLNKLRAEATKLAIIDGVKVIKELGKLGFSNIQDFIDIDEDGNIKFISFDSIGRDKLAAVESIKVRTTTTGTGKSQSTTETTEFKLCSKEGALDKLGKHFGIFEKDNTQRLKPFILVFNHKDQTKEVVCNQS